MWKRKVRPEHEAWLLDAVEKALRRDTEQTSLHPSGQFVEFDVNERMRGDKLERYQSYSLGILGGFEYADEIRAEEGKPPLPGGIGRTTLASMLQRVKEEKDNKGVTRGRCSGLLSDEAHDRYKDAFGKIVPYRVLGLAMRRLEREGRARRVGRWFSKSPAWKIS